MRSGLAISVLAILAAAGAGCAPVGETRGTQGGAGPGALPPEDEAPLLLEDDASEPSPADGPVADNSRCFVCHMNYMREDLAVAHARAQIGCADCHGDCDAHIADESWASGGKGTPPGIMYPPAKVNPFCMGCHPRDDIDTEPHARLLAGTAEKKLCTDCHGDHRLPVRRCKWK